MFAISPTDLNWFQQLRTDGLQGNVINFWTPTPWNISRLKSGDNLYFMLKSPIRKIGGYGKFVEYKNMKASEAWKAYGRDNGVEDLTHLIARTAGYASKHSKNPVLPNPEIGCILLTEPVFFDNDNFVTDKSLGVNFPNEVVKIKYFDEQEKIVVQKVDIKVESSFGLIDSGKSTRKQLTQKERKGQASFRKNILHVYNGACAITGIKQKEVLEAAHIQTYINEESNHIQNGICLRVDIHKLFDNGLLGIDSNYRVVISSLLATTAYKKIKGKKIKLPKDKSYYPSLKALGYHNKFKLRK